MRELLFAIWLEGFFQKRKSLSYATHLRIPSNETREELMTQFHQNRSFWEKGQPGWRPTEKN